MTQWFLAVALCTGLDGTACMPMPPTDCYRRGYEPECVGEKFASGPECRFAALLVWMWWSQEPGITGVKSAQCYETRMPSSLTPYRGK